MLYISVSLLSCIPCLPLLSPFLNWLCENKWPLYCDMWSSRAGHSQPLKTISLHSSLLGAHYMHLNFAQVKFHLAYSNHKTRQAKSCMRAAQGNFAQTGQLCPPWQLSVLITLPLPTVSAKPKVTLIVFGQSNWSFRFSVLNTP